MTLDELIETTNTPDRTRFMTEADLLTDLDRLLRDGFVYLYAGDDDTAAGLHLAVTARGRDWSTADGLFCTPAAAPPPVSDVSDTRPT